MSGFNGWNNNNTSNTPSFFFGSPSLAPTPSSRAVPPNPFADDSPFATPNFNSTYETTASEQPCGKRKRIEIEPIEIQPRTENVFFSRPPLTPTSPLVPPPSQLFPVTPSTPQTPMKFSAISHDLDQIMSSIEDPDEDARTLAELIGYVKKLFILIK